MSHIASPPTPQRSLLVLTIVGLVPFIAFHWIMQSYLRMIMWPWMLIWQVGLVAICILGIVLLRQFQRPFKLLGYGLDWLVAIFLLGLIISTLFAPFPPVAIWNASRIFCFVIVLYVGRNCLQNDRLQFIFSRPNLWLGTVAIGAVTGMISLSLWRPTTKMWLSDEFNDAIRNHLPLGNNNFVGGYEVLLFPLTLTFALAHSGWRRIFGIIATLISAAMLYTSGSRGALLGAIVMVIAFSIAALIRSQGQQKIWAIGLSGLSLILLAVALISNPRIRQFIFTNGVQDSFHRVFSDGPILDRIMMLETVGNLFKEHPLAGVGPGNMSFVYNLYRPVESGNWLMQVQQLHNTPAQILGEIGIFGILAYGLFILYFVGLNIKLFSHWQNSQQRYLALGLTVSILSYAVSSITDYQLENIGIITLLIVILWLWVDLLETSALEEIQILPPIWILDRPSVRRLISIGLLLFLGLCWVVWFPIDAAVAISSRATHQAIAGDFAAADRSWSLAAQLVPWDPIYPAAAGQKLIQIAATINNPQDELAIENEAIEHYRKAVKAAPYDAFFQHNLAVILLPHHLEEVLVPATRSVNLENRDTSYTYYLLGLAYLNGGEIEKAIDSFVLQGINTPKFLTFTLDTEPNLKPFKTEILNRSLRLFDRLLQALSPTDPTYALAKQNIYLVRWWQQQLTPPQLAEISNFPSIFQALLLAESQSQKAIDLLNQTLSTTPTDQASLILRAWIQPDRYFDAVAALIQDPNRIQFWQKNIQDHRDLRSWLRSQIVPENPEERLALWLTYRNMNSVNASKIFMPPGIAISDLAKNLNLYPQWPRYCPELDRLIDQYLRERL